MSTNAGGMQNGSEGAPPAPDGEPTGGLPGEEQPDAAGDVFGVTAEQRAAAQQAAQGEPEGEPEGDEGDDSAWYEGVEAFAPETEEFYRRQGYTSPEEALHAHAELAGLYGQQSAELGDLRRAVDQLQGQLQGQQQAANQPNQSIAEQVPMLEQQLLQAVQNGDMEIEDAFARISHANRLATDERIEAAVTGATQRLEEQFNPQLAQLASSQLEGDWRRSAANIKRQLGQETYDALAPAASRYIQAQRARDPNFGQSPQAVEQAFQVAAYERQVAQQRAADAQVTTPAAGSPPATTIDPDQAIMDEVDAIGGSGAMSGGMLAP